MKTITIKQPWAFLIVKGIKPIENRTWPTKFRGRVLIHAGAKTVHQSRSTSPIFTDAQYSDIKTKMGSNNDEVLYYTWERCGFPDRIISSIVGSVEIVDCVVNYTSIWAEHGSKKETRKNKGGVVFIDEIEIPVYNWILANPILFPEPIPAKGKLSFWDYPQISAEPEEKDGPLFCHCQLPVKEEVQVMRLIDQYRCRYCGGRWYK